MKKARFTETQIVHTLKLSDSGLNVEKIFRQSGVSNTTYYNWKNMAVWKPMMLKN
ncbi:transposase [Rosenbergiella collisarenosi]|uniref:transposase n=1 Tax=Rosenbergiella collisarenosi TaxID=1544695 RepID=UPI003F6CE8BB